ncbi:coenzyme F390 synthetase [Pseudonocardia sp. N23]|nr:coenzyme F390 synthetase [Pseudonocardia sp. N23]
MILECLPRLEKSDIVGRERAYQRRLPGLDATTSGTTGTPLALRRSVGSVLVEEAWISHHRGWAGHRPGDVTAVMRGEVVADATDAAAYRYVPARRTLLLSSYHVSERAVAGYLDALRTHRVKWLAAYPSSIASLTAVALARGLALPPLTAIFTSSETLAPQTREAIESAWGCRIWDHYGHAERTVAAMECEERRYHLVPGYGIVEQVDDGLLTTNLTNSLMPLLRYRVTDTVEGWDTGRCACGRAGRHFATVAGRMEDVVIGEGGRRIGRLDFVFKGVEGVLAGQIC